MNFCLHGSARTVREAVERAVRAEQLGFEAIFFADSHMNNVDPYQAMALCAKETNKIRFGTAVTNMVYRDPSITANSFATLNEISEGRAIIGLGRSFNMPIVAEGVETAEQFAELRKVGCEYAQGFYLSKPVTAEEAGLLIAAQPWEGVSCARSA